MKKKMIRNPSRSNQILKKCLHLPKRPILPFEKGSYLSILYLWIDRERKSLCERWRIRQRKKRDTCTSRYTAWSWTLDRRSDWAANPTVQPLLHAEQIIYQLSLICPELEGLYPWRRIWIRKTVAAASPSWTIQPVNLRRYCILTNMRLLSK